MLADPFPVQSVAYAMKPWNEHMIVVFDRRVAIFRLPSFDSQADISVSHEILSLPIAFEEEAWDALICGAEFLKVPEQVYISGQGALQLVGRVRGGAAFSVFISISSLRGSDPTFSVSRPGWLERSDAIPEFRAVVSLCAGSKYALFFIASFFGRPELLLTHIQTSDDQLDPKEDFVAFVRPSLVSKAGLPLLYNWPCFAVDDACGLLLMGTSAGDLCALRFLDDGALEKRCFVDDLLPDLSLATNDRSSSFNCRVSWAVPHGTSFLITHRLLFLWIFRRTISTIARSCRATIQLPFSPRLDTSGAALLARH